MDIVRIPDDMLRRMAEAESPKGAASNILREVIAKRRKDRQVFAWRIGSYYFVGPVPDAETEAAIIEFAGDDEDDD
jgi:hypothetical protein